VTNTEAGVAGPQLHPEPGRRAMPGGNRVTNTEAGVAGPQLHPEPGRRAMPGGNQVTNTEAGVAGAQLHPEPGRRPMSGGNRVTNTEPGVAGAQAMRGEREGCPLANPFCFLGGGGAVLPGKECSADAATLHHASIQSNTEASWHARRAVPRLLPPRRPRNDRSVDPLVEGHLLWAIRNNMQRRPGAVLHPRKA
jgi:hypothetical protein